MYSITKIMQITIKIRIKYKNTNRQQMHKESFIISRNTLLHVSTLLGHLQGELFVIVTPRLQFIAEGEYAVDCVLRCFWRRELSVVPAWTARPFSLNYKVQP
jgi:hypothetical protein